jgi:hypothetical protein
MQPLKQLENDTCVRLAIALAVLLTLSGCSLKVKKDSEGRENKVDIETPVGALHVATDAEAGDIGLPIYPGARLKKPNNHDDNNRAQVNISSNMFGFKIVAVEYLSDDAPEKLVAYYRDKLKKYGNVLECHTDKEDVDPDIDPDDHSNKLKCEGDHNGNTVELKVGTKQSQHIASIKPGDDKKGSDFALVFLSIRGGKDTI